MRLRLRRRAGRRPQCTRCRGVAPWTYDAAPETHEITTPARLCLECWTGTRREDIEL